MNFEAFIFCFFFCVAGSMFGMIPSAATRWCYNIDACFL